MKALKPILFALGAAFLFAGTFIVFATVRGAMPYELPLIGRFFPHPQEEADDAKEVVESGAPKFEKPAPPVPAGAQAGLGLFDVFRIDSPMSADELKALASELKRKNADADRRAHEQSLEQERLNERSLQLDEQMARIVELRSSLESWELALSDREATLQVSEAKRAEEEMASWQRMAKLFEKGDAASLSLKLSAYTPLEAAQILRNLKPERARELLEGLSGESWKPYWDAYRAAPNGEKP